MAAGFACCRGVECMECLPRQRTCGGRELGHEETHMRNGAAISVFSWLAPIALGPLLVVACSGSSFSPSGSTSGGSAGVAGSGATGGVALGGGSSGGAGGGSPEACDKSQCGPQLGLPNQICSDGSTGGPTERCIKNANGSCGWEIRQCPPDGAGGDAAGGAPGTGGSAGGAAGAGGSAGACGGKTCSVDQVCCGPAECGRCISKLSTQACASLCPTGGGGSGGTPDCAQLFDDVTKAQAAAQACNPASAKPAAECAGSLEGVCCPIGVEDASATAPNNAAYLGALKAYKASCTQPCPRIACIEPVVGDCQASGGDNKCVP